MAAISLISIAMVSNYKMAEPGMEQDGERRSSFLVMTPAKRERLEVLGNSYCIHRLNGDIPLVSEESSDRELDSFER